MVLITDKFHKASNGTRAEATTLTAQKALAASSISTAALNGWPTDTPVNFQLYTTDTQGNIVPGSQSDWVGIVSGTTITQLQLTGGSDDIYPIGTIVVCLPTSDWADSLVEGILTQHNQDGTHGAVTASSLTSTSGLTVSGGTVTLPSASIAQTALPTGTLVQEVASSSNAVATGTTIIPLDDTIPQNTEGDQYLTVTITPKSSSNLLIIESTVMGAHSVNAHLIQAMYQDSTANALTATAVYQASPQQIMTWTSRYTMTAGTTSATTFKIRAGGSAAGTFTFNGSSSGRFFGAITKSSLVVREIKA